MATLNNTRPKQTDDFIRIQDLFYLCIGKWHWFVISLVVTVGAAVTYLLTTPPVYTRSAALLIKEEGKGNSMGDMAGMLGDFDLFHSSTNVNNEIQSLQSPAVMCDVVKRLRLDVNYLADGVFYRKTLYGQSLPCEVIFADLQDNEGAAFTLHPGTAGTVWLSDFSRNGDDLEGDVEAQLGDTVDTPVGRLLIKPLFNDSLAMDVPIHVSRIGLQTATDIYCSSLTVTLNDEKSTVINLSIRDVCTQRAEDVLNTLIAIYNENWIKDKNQIAVSTSAFINERLGVIEQELGNVDENISSYKSEHLLPDVQAAASMYMAQSSETNAQILALNTQLSMARYIRNYLTNATAKNQLLPANSGIESPGIEQQIASYNTAQLRRNDLVANSSEKNPLVIDMDNSLQNMRKAIVSSIDNHVVTLNTQLRALRQSERQNTTRIAANPSQGKYLLSVERQQKVKEALYLFLLQKREENELSQAFTAYNTRVITPPTGSLLPTAPVKRNILLVAFALGILIPVVIIFMEENMNTKVRGRKDLEGLSLPFAGEIPVAFKKQRKGNKETESIIIRQGQRNVINEAFRVLRTNLEFMLNDCNDGRASVVLFTSFNPGSGKTFLTMNTSASLALKGKRVLVIDGDLRHGSASAYIGSPSKGLSDYLGKRENNVESLIKESSDYPSLHILPVGTIPPNPTELLAEPRFKELIENLRRRYDYIFIDCPPVEIVADTQIIEKQVDRTLFVVRAGLLERDMLPELQRCYDEKRYKNMAVLLNGTKGDNGRYGYKYGYHYGYGNNDYYGNKK
ncbi:polysaccharide biosynthesis tyrosine autokinase [uncultured Parabacteroides sp.]|uniref:GumC family protein n=1 Tax=uncultured Parabacteroides sp. TaxID=512312 RepID=UPI00262B5385|nr:polysaccharide biosynthesis tyrosine autokinase [uncultured Parabacteroides sp.]